MLKQTFTSFKIFCVNQQKEDTRYYPLSCRQMQEILICYFTLFIDARYIQSNIWIIKKICILLRAIHKNRQIAILKKQNQTKLQNYLKALSHYNVLANVCRRMKYISSTLAYAEI